MHNSKKTPLGSRGKSEPKRVSEVLNEMFTQTLQGSPTTEPCVDLKMVLQAPFALMPGEAVNGTLGRDTADHFTFFEEAKEEKAKRHRRKTRYVYRGELVNVVEQPDGTRILTLRRVCFVEKNHQTLSFLSYCCRVIREISQIVRMTKF